MGYTVKIKEFEGPLELLYKLISEREFSINEVSLGLVTEEYFSYLNAIKEQQSGSYHTDIASFIVIAATLMLIKSRSLLPGFFVTAEEEEDIKELEERLKAYKAIKEMAGKLGALVTARQPLFGREPLPFELHPEFLPPARPLDLQRMASLLQALLHAIPKKEELPKKTIKKVVSIEEKIKELERRIQDGVVRSFTDFVGQKNEKLTIIVSFLAMLELIKIGAIVAQQSLPFEQIAIEHGNGSRKDH